MRKGIPMCDYCTNGVWPGWDVHVAPATMDNGMPASITTYFVWEETQDTAQKIATSKFKMLTTSRPTFCHC